MITQMERSLDNDYDTWKSMNWTFLEISKGEDRERKVNFYNLIRFYISIASDLSNSVIRFHSPHDASVSFFEIDNHFVVEGNKFPIVLGIRHDISSADELSYRCIFNEARKMQKVFSYIPLRDLTERGKSRFDKLDTELLYEYFKSRAPENVRKFL
ncbi:MAG: hypothetical protein WC584_04665 [Candidatus Pacearchaeota archaeon]